MLSYSGWYVTVPDVVSVSWGLSNPSSEYIFSQNLEVHLTDYKVVNGAFAPVGCTYVG